MHNSRKNLKAVLVDEIGVQHSGGNYILDKGAPPEIFSQYLKSFSPYIAMVKLGWTTWSLFSDTELSEKIKSAKEFGIPLCLGGTFFEICHSEGLYPDLLDFVVDNGFSCIEIASGFKVEVDELPEAIRQAKSRGLQVMVEVGFKDQERDNALSPRDRADHIESALKSGADFVILEARESGAGFSIFKDDSSANESLIDLILSITTLSKIIFEAPTRDTQIALTKRIGPDANMGNIPFDEIPRVETIRRGLHADTYIPTNIRNLGKE